MNFRQAAAASASHDRWPWAAAALAGLAAVFIVLGHDGRRVAQLLLLAWPLLAWLAWPVGGRAARRIRRIGYARIEFGTLGRHPSGLPVQGVQREPGNTRDRREFARERGFAGP